MVETVTKSEIKSYRNRLQWSLQKSQMDTPLKQLISLTNYCKESLSRDWEWTVQWKWRATFGSETLTGAVWRNRQWEVYIYRFLLMRTWTTSNRSAKTNQKTHWLCRTDSCCGRNRFRIYLRVMNIIFIDCFIILVRSYVWFSFIFPIHFLLRCPHLI